MTPSEVLLRATIERLMQEGLHPTPTLITKILIANGSGRQVTNNLNGREVKVLREYVQPIVYCALPCTNHTPPSIKGWPRDALITNEAGADWRSDFAKRRKAGTVESGQSTAEVKGSPME